MIKTILYTTDFSEEAENALPHALTLSLLFDAKLILFNAQVLHQDDPSNPLYHLPEKEELCKKAEEISKNMLDKKACEMGDIKFETITRRDLFADRAILSIAEEKMADLIVMGTHGRRGFSKLLIGSTTLNVLKFSKIPVYVVPPNVKAPSKEKPYRELLVCMDFSCASMEALDMAKIFKEKSGAKLHIIHILEGSDKEAKKKMEELEKDTKFEKKSILKGKIEKEILKYAREEAIDLIFLGNKSEKEELFALGSKVERIVLNSPCPCLVTKL
ncbi:MAG: universal stress protein [Thermoanaerobaculia bacterium]